MKRLLLILILTLSFQSWTKADDINDFEIEGMSIGDSLLDYFNKEEIKKNKKDYYKNKKNFQFFAIDIENHNSFKKYEGMQFHLKKNDNDYTIYSISGYNYCRKDIRNCKNQIEIIKKEFLKTFKDLITDKSTYEHSGDKSKKSIVTDTTFYFKNNDIIRLNIYDWSEEMPYADNYDVTLSLNEFRLAFIK